MRAWLLSGQLLSMNAAIVLVYIFASPTNAQYYWDVNTGIPGSGNASGSWNVGTNWSTDSNGSIATIGWTDGNAAVFSAGTDGIGTLNIGVTGTVSPTTLTTEEGIINLTGGTITPSNGGNSVIVRGGSTLRISGATVTTSASGVIYVGDTTPGTLDMVSGSLSAQRLDIGNPANGPGFVTQSGGTINLTGGSGLPGMRLSHWPGSGRTYNMSGGVLNATASTAVLAIGWDGSGTMTVNGTADVNAHTVQIQRGSTLTIGGNSTFDVASSMKVGDDRGAGTLNIQDSATVNIAGFSIGDDSGDAGTVNQSGGTVNVSGLYQLGHWPSQTSSYNISAGTLNVNGTPGASINPAGVGEQAGVLYIGVDGTGTLNVSGSAQVNAQAIVLDARGNTAGTDTFTLNGGTVTLTSTTAFGNGIRTGNNDANTSYQINLGGGTLAAGNSWSSPLNMTLTGGNTTFDPNANTITLTGTLSGPGALSKVDSGTLILGGNNSYGGGTTMSAGTTRVANFDSALGSGALNITGNSLLATASGGGARTLANAINISAGQTLSVDGNFATLTLNGPITGAGSNLQKTSNGTVQIGGTVSGLSNLSVKGAGGSLDILPTANITTNRLVTADEAGGTTSVNQSGGTVTVTGTNNTNTTSASLLIGHWPAASAYNLTNGTLNSTGAMMSLGWDSPNATFNQSNGVVNLLGINLNNGRNNFAAYNLTGGNLNIGASGITTNLNKHINLGGGTVGALASWSSTQPITLTGTGGNTTFNTGSNTISLGGLLSGIGGLVKTGSGTLVTSGDNIYSGTTTVNDGTVIINGTTSGQGNYIVASGARLGGDGTIGLATGNNVAVSAFPGELSPGAANVPYTPPATPTGYTGHAFDATYSAGLDVNTVGSLNVVGDVDMGGNLLIDLVSPTIFDSLDVAGTFNIGTTADLEINGQTDFTQLDFFGELGFDYGDRVDLVLADEIIGNFSNVIANAEFEDARGHSIYFGNDGSSLYLQAVPEPSTLVLWSLIALVGTAVGYRMHRRRDC
jgi:autotransporter-associated beta strand protein/T5SS/PEP-CTERM-associated repeat protein